jgi:outer membrane lipoprotein-sorting protein
MPAIPARRRLSPPAGPRLAAAVLLAVLFSAILCARPAAAAQGEKLLALISQMESSYARIQDYTAVFLKKERWRDKPLPEERIMVKFQKPLKVYMKWLDGPDKEALYVNGQYNNKVLARCGGLLGLVTWTFSPTDSALMDRNRHPITDLGFGFIIAMMRKDIPQALDNGEIEIVRMDEDVFNGRPATTIELRFAPKDGRQYYTTHAIFHVDKEYLLPVGVACYDEREVLQEQYSYQDVKLNAGLSEMDFSKGNKAYRF